MRSLYLLSSFLLLTSCVAFFTPRVEREVVKLKPGQYRLDPAHTSALFKVQHLQLSTFVGRFNRVMAELDFNPKKLSETRLKGTIDISSIDVNNRDLEHTLKDSDWLNAAQYPQAIITTKSVTAVDDRRFIFHAEMELLGIQRPIDLQVTFLGGADNWLSGFYTLGFSAQGVFKRSDFGLDHYIPMVGDEIIIEVEAEFQQRD